MIKTKYFWGIIEFDLTKWLHVINFAPMVKALYSPDKTNKIYLI